MANLLPSPLEINMAFAGPTMTIRVDLDIPKPVREALAALGWTPPGEQTADLAPNLDAMASVYRERAALVAHLAAVYPSAIVHGADPSEPDWPVIFIDTPHGQLSWHLALEDLGLFGHVEEFAGPDVEGAPKWDGHDTAEKYVRLHACTGDTALDQKYAT